MITKLKTFESDYVDNQIDIQTAALTGTQSEPGFPYGRKMLVLESNWKTDDVYNSVSVHPFFSNLSKLMCVHQSIEVGLRNFDSLSGLKFYTEFPNGKIWNDPHCWGTSVYYISTHGGKTILQPTMGVVGETEMMDSFKGFDLYPNILFFGGCGIFDGKIGDDFGRDLVESSGTRGVFGYKSPEVGTIDGIIIEMLFFTRFFGLKDEEYPFEKLPNVYNSVLNDYPKSRELGLSMYLR